MLDDVIMSIDSGLEESTMLLADILIDEMSDFDDDINIETEDDNNAI